MLLIAKRWHLKKIKIGNMKFDKNGYKWTL